VKKMYKLYIFFTRGYGRSSMVCVCVFSLENREYVVSKRDSFLVLSLISGFTGGCTP
jgi:hypothetical protein